MNEATLIAEFKSLHDRLDNLNTANTGVVNSSAETVLKIRAYENLINNSWLLSRFLPHKDVVAEMKRVDELEGTIREVQAERVLRGQEQQKQIDEASQEEQDILDKIEKGGKKLDRLLRKKGSK